MNKTQYMNELLDKNNGFFKTSDVVAAGISKTYLLKYAKTFCLERLAHGLYMSADSWDDEMYVLQFRYPKAIFSHETALYLLEMANREPLSYSMSFQSSANATALKKTRCNCI